MIIADLNYLELVSEKNIALSGGYASADAYTIADYGIGFAQADAAAIGQSTLTLTKTSTAVSITPVSAITYASAKALAKSRTAHSYYRAQDSSVSLYIST